MAGKTKSMTQIRKILQSARHGQSIREIARNTGMSKNTVKRYLRKIAEQGYATEGVLKMNDKALSQIVERPPGKEETDRYESLEKRFAAMSEELRQVGMTRMRLWEAYRQEEPGGYKYSQFCEYFRRWQKEKQVVMILDHNPGEETMMDYAGKKLSYINRETGEVIACDVFVSVLPYSGMAYCEAMHSQKGEELVIGMASSLEWFGGATRAIKVDNMRSAVKKADRYEPSLTELMDEFGKHYGVTVMTARVRKPRDKASVEGSVKLVYQRVYAELRNQIFFSIEELNAAIRACVTRHNKTKMQGREYSRYDRFLAEEKHTLQALPETRFKYYKSAEYTVQKDYHIMLGEDRHRYSVPYHLVGKRVHVRYNRDDVEIYYDHERVAVHRREYTRHHHTTIPSHMPESHRSYQEQRGWTAEDMTSQAKKIGHYTTQVIQGFLARPIFIQQSFTSCLGIFSLGKKYSHHRLEAACRRALTHGGSPTYTMIKDILRQNLDTAEVQTACDFETPHHDNLRGAAHYDKLLNKTLTQ
jgi:transposase